MYWNTKWSLHNCCFYYTMSCSHHNCLPDSNSSNYYMDFCPQAGAMVNLPRVVVGGMVVCGMVVGGIVVGGNCSPWNSLFNL